MSTSMEQEPQAAPENQTEVSDMEAESQTPSVNDARLFRAAADGDLEECERLLQETDADPCSQDPNTGMSILMVAAAAGHVEIVRLLLEEGAPWNAVDRGYLCAGDYATKNGHQEVIDVILKHAVTSELLLGALLQNEHREDDNLSYLKNEVEYTAEGDKLLDSEGLAVMMDWEKPLMEAHATFVTSRVSAQGQGRVLNVGFGMGIVDTAIQTCLGGAPREHYIIEAHFKVIERMKATGWHEKPGVVICTGRWQDVVPQLIAKCCVFDGIFFDTYAEDDFDLKQFHTHLPQLLADGGHYSFYNGMCPDNVFFHAVACETVQLQLKNLGLECTYKAMPVDVSDGKLWSGVRSRYWHFDHYYLPECVKRTVTATNTEPAAHANGDQTHG